MTTSTMHIDEWLDYAAKGAQIPLTVPLQGSSMEPLIRYRIDPVTIVPLNREPLVGDIVMFLRADGAYVVHRVWRVEPDFVQTWGDNCARPDAPLARDRVLGLVIAMHRNGKVHPLDTDAQRAYGLRWFRYGRHAWQRYQRLRRVGGKAVRLVFPRFHEKGK